jgi:hypothetical protein
MNHKHTLIYSIVVCNNKTKHIFTIFVLDLKLCFEHIFKNNIIQ